MAKKDPVTPAIRELRARKVPFETFQFPYQEKGGTAVSSAALGVPENQVIKSIVFEDDEGKGHLVLMHGDDEVSAKNLARMAGRRTMRPAGQDLARKWTGYEFGGTSPFGLRVPLQIWLQESILSWDKVWVNGGKRGFLVCLEPRVFLEVCGARPGAFGQGGQ